MGNRSIWGKQWEKVVKKSSFLSAAQPQASSTHKVGQANLDDSLAGFQLRQVELQLAKLRLQEERFEQGIARSNYVVEEVLPLISTTMTLLKQSIDVTSRVVMAADADNLTGSQEVADTFSELTRRPVKYLRNEKVRLENLNLMLNDFFERLYEKRDVLKNWAQEAVPPRLG
ncbi:hypothetical protein KAH55_10230 [bacterium]|nr:hypothetical protein [bacterium]